MNVSEINWDISEANTWPKPIKISAGILVLITIIGLGHYQFISEKVTQLNTEKQAVTDALNRYQDAWRIAQNLELHQKQYKEIQAFLVEMIKLMPTKAGVISLLDDISQAGLSSGLKLELFKPREEVDEDAVIEIPIDIKVIGQYSELVLFISSLAMLPRITTIKNIQIISTKNTPLLAMNALVAIYREGISQVETDKDLLDNSALVCLKHDGLAVLGCKKKSKAVVSYPELEQRLKEKRKNTKPIPVKPIEPMQPVESFLFTPYGLRDPFRQIEEIATPAVAHNGIQPSFDQHEELQNYPLDTLRMMGTVKMRGVFWGLIKTGDGIIHRVQKGHHLGKNYGRILSISQNKIEIMEIIPDESGSDAWRERHTSMELSE